MAQTVELSTLGAVIATAYEAVPDRNKFSDAEKIKLAGLPGPDVEPPASGTVDLTDAENAAIFNNEGAIALTEYNAPSTLPSGISSVGYSFINLAVTGTRFNAQAGQIIRLGESSSSDGGYIETMDVGAAFTLILVGNTWVVMNSTGNYSFT